MATLPVLRWRDPLTVVRRLCAALAAMLALSLAPGLALGLILGLSPGLLTPIPAASAQPAAQRQAATAPGPINLTEAEVIRLASERAPAAVVASATEALAQARTRSAGLWPNPALSWDQEAAGAETENAVRARLPVNIARPRTTRALAAADGAWMRAQAALTRTDAVLAALLAYYDVVVSVKQVEIRMQAVANLDEAARVLRQREAAGVASGYESTRLAIARELSRSHLADAQAALQSTKTRLAAILGIGTKGLQVATTLTLLAESEKAAVTEPGPPAHAAIAHAQAAQRFAGQADRHAEWAWVPTVELGAGVRHVSDLGYGYVLGVSLNIPIFDHGQGIQAEATAQRALARTRTQALTRTIDGERERARVDLATARAELMRFERETAGPVATLMTAAHSGYREGERSIVELLDAQRTQIDVAERHLRLLATAKRAEARLRAAAGDLQ